MMRNEGITITELMELCKLEIKRGNGDKHILISSDDEGNEFHTLFYGFTTEKGLIESCKQGGLFHDDNDADAVVILG